MKVFIDASVILAALGSASGGSAVILKLTQKEKLKGVISQAIIEEVKRNAANLNRKAEDVERIILKSRLEIVEASSLEAEQKYAKLAGKDAHVVASAVQAKADILLTLDKKHLLNEDVKGRLKNLGIMAPGELIKKLPVKK